MSQLLFACPSYTITSAHTTLPNFTKLRFEFFSSVCIYLIYEGIIQLLDQKTHMTRRGQLK